MKKIRCAIYTRKSSEEGLEQEFNSLDAQREACEAYIFSQKHEGWVLIPTDYDDGGLSGGSLERPALQRLLQAMRDGHVDQVVVYKIDRLTRSLADFSKIVDVLDAVGASFVSVTQSFNTATSMGRLTLNMLLSFAQFEREVTAERIRDKIAASKRKGLWMGGLVPIGYDADGRTLSINEGEAATVRKLYELYEENGTVRAVKERADGLLLRTKLRAAADGSTSGGGPFARGHIHQILTNPLYAGRIRHLREVHDGQHPALIDPERWEAIQVTLQDGAAKARNVKTGTARSLLCGKLFDETGDRLTPSHTKMRTGKRFRYYVSHRLIAKNGEDQDGWRLPAAELEERIAGLLRSEFSKPSFAPLLITNASASRFGAVKAALADWLECNGMKRILHMIETVTISPGRLECKIDVSALGAALGVDADMLSEENLAINSMFQLRKRGVETRLIFADQPTGRDPKLVANIAKAHRWYEQIKSGRTLDQLAASEQTSKRRIQQMIDLAFLAPDIIRNVLDGKQPIGFTSDWAKKHGIPSDWDAQRKLLKTL